MPIVKKQTKGFPQRTPKEPKEKEKMIFIRLPATLRNRLDHQVSRLCASMNMVVRMALVKFLEEEESKEKYIK